MLSTFISELFSWVTVAPYSAGTAAHQAVFVIVELGILNSV